jgi:hypothetical protein
MRRQLVSAQRSRSVGSAASAPGQPTRVATTSYGWGNL